MDQPTKKKRRVARARPGFHKVRVKRKTYVFARIRKQEYEDDPVILNGMNFINYVAKESLRRVKEIFNIKT